MSPLTWKWSENGFYEDRSKPVPLFVAKRDESLVSYVERGQVAPGRALDLGCGPALFRRPGGACAFSR